VPEIAIRPIEEADLPFLMGLEHSCQTLAVWQLDRVVEEHRWGGAFRLARRPRPVHVEYPQRVADLPQRWQAADLALTALFQNQPVAYVTLKQRREADVFWVEDLVTRLDLRRQGIATALLLACRSWALQGGGKAMAMEVPAKNVPMIELASQLGYVFSGYREAYYANQEIAAFFFHCLR
jgi:GNAT superfamily N-acetyltransferase